MWFFCADEGSIFTYSNYLPHKIEGKKTLIFINWQGFFKDFVMLPKWQSSKNQLANNFATC